jgi:cytochrome P450
MAGADSTSITMRSVFYFLMKHPLVLDRVRAEVDAAFENGTLSSPVQYSQAVALPYLNAVVRDATRVFPAFQVSQPRYAPAQGIELCGIHIPSGYTIGLNPAIIQHDRRVFGEDAQEFNPERWLRSEERTRAMDKAILGWGAGTRTCVGRPVCRTDTLLLTCNTNES